jgi:membrane protein YdbS with pleckstrin-like domain
MKERSMENKVATGGSPVTTTLLIVFVVLKLTGNIDWSWWWVLSPLWIPAAFFFAIILLGFILLKSSRPLFRWPQKD